MDEMLKNNMKISFYGFLLSLFGVGLGVLGVIFKMKWLVWICLIVFFTGIMIYMIGVIGVKFQFIKQAASKPANRVALLYPYLFGVAGMLIFLASRFLHNKWMSWIGIVIFFMGIFIFRFKDLFDISSGLKKIKEYLNKK